MNKKDIFILPNGIKDNLSNKEFEKIIQERKKNKKLQLLFLSNMIETKGPLDVLYICNELKKKKIEFECSFVGKFQDSNFEKKFFKELNSLNLERECKYLGPKYGKEKFKILEKTNYLIFPTTYPEETFGLVIIESFMYGIPALSYDNASIKEIILNKKLGYVSKKGDWENISKELIKRIKKVESSKEIREEFKKKYLLDNVLKDLKRILRIGKN
ncbi:MAG: glycosyltransferase [Candidatus Absconditabacterales bacterium]|nr:glycosyltransferase [Candidatus Absconditabacterales bacterium]